MIRTALWQLLTDIDSVLALLLCGFAIYCEVTKE